MNRFDPRKVFYQAEKLVELKKTGDTWPVHIQMGLTSACNHRCIFCSGGHSVENTRHDVMDYDILLQTLRQATAHGLKAVTLVGFGEPLCYPRVGELLEAMQEMHLEIGIFTNGALLNEKLRKFVAENCTFIRFSVNGGTAEAHEKVHQVPGDFDRVVHNIRELVKLRNIPGGGTNLPTIGTQMVFFEDNYHSLAEAARLWHDVGVDYFEIKPYTLTNYDLKDRVIPAQDADAVQKEIEAAKAYEDEHFKIYAKFGMYQRQKAKPEDRSYDFCYGSSISGMILESGEVVPCCHIIDKAHSFGNLNEQTFEEIWTGERRKQVLASIDVKKCLSGCHQDGLNDILWDFLHPQRINHPYFL